MAFYWDAWMALNKQKHDQNPRRQCVSHMSRFMLAQKILWHGYYWLTRESDCFKHVQKCHLCQIYADRINQPPALLHNMTSLWPFSMWGIEATGMVHPKASNGQWLIHVAINHFTTWVEGASFVNVTKAQVVPFIKQNVICRYGLPQYIIIGIAQNLNNGRLMPYVHNTEPSIRIQRLTGQRWMG